MQYALFIEVHDQRSLNPIQFTPFVNLASIITGLVRTPVFNMQPSQAPRVIRGWTEWKKCYITVSSERHKPAAGSRRSVNLAWTESSAILEANRACPDWLGRPRRGRWTCPSCLRHE